MICPEASNVICYDVHTITRLSSGCRNLHSTIQCGFFLSVLTRHRQDTDCRTWSILKTSSSCRKLRQRSFLSKHEFKRKL